MAQLKQQLHYCRSRVLQQSRFSKRVYSKTGPEYLQEILIKQLTLNFTFCDKRFDSVGIIIQNTGLRQQSPNSEYNDIPQRFTQAVFGCNVGFVDEHSLNQNHKISLSSSFRPAQEWCEFAGAYFCD